VAHAAHDDAQQVADVAMGVADENTRHARDDRFARKENGLQDGMNPV
jgi:hypothetical protein